MSTGPLHISELNALFSPLAQEPHWGLAVSGGGDSMALMVLAVRWRDQQQGGCAPRISVLSVDHGLRAGSAREVDFVAGSAAALGLDHVVLKWPGPKPKTGIQAAARKIRYDLMTSYAREQGMSCLVTAHHLDDQAETLLMRLRRGSGIDGLAAMSMTGSWAGFRVARPLLDIPGARLKASLRAAGHVWVEDPSNDDETYERVRLRKAMRVLLDMGYSAEKLSVTARRMRRASDALDFSAREFLHNHVTLHAAGYCEIPARLFAALPEEIAIRALKMMLEPLGGAATPPGLSQLERLTAALRENASCAHTLAGCRIIPDEGNLLILREAGRNGLGELKLHPGERAIWDRRVQVSLTEQAPSPVIVRALGKGGVSEVRARLKKPLSVPSGAAYAVASFWADGRLLCAPQLGFSASFASCDISEAPAAVYTARFLNCALFSHAGPMPESVKFNL